MTDTNEPSWRDIRPVALGIATRGEELLVIEYHDAAADETFYRPPGGGINFGEAAADAVAREFAEELGWDVRVGERLAVLENRFTFEGTEGHEYVMVYPVEPGDETVYDRAEFLATESNGDEYRVVWKPIDAFRGDDGAVLYPEGVLKR